MQRCLKLAAKGKSRVSPNPKVGALLVGQNGDLLGEGFHVRFGGRHAEARATSDAEQRHGSDVLRMATLYVNLEPCNHVGKTPRCVDLILKKGISRVVFGMTDPNPTAAHGATYLRQQGIKVTGGVLESACKRLNEAFSHHVATGRPLVTLKIAQTLDGRIAGVSGKSRWITGKKARSLVHEWRAEHDGVLIGSGTALKDDPALTVRLATGDQPHRYVLDHAGTLPQDLQVFTDKYADHTTAIVGLTEPSYARALAGAGGHILMILREKDRHLDLHTILESLGHGRGHRNLPLLSLLVEAGPRLATALLKEDLVDRLFVFVAPKILGSGLPSFHGFGVTELTDALTFAEHSWEKVGEDMLFRGYRHAC